MVCRYTLDFHGLAYLFGVWCCVLGLVFGCVLQSVSFRMLWFNALEFLFYEDVCFVIT